MLHRNANQKLMYDRLTTIIREGKFVSDGITYTVQHEKTKAYNRIKHVRPKDSVQWIVGITSTGALACVSSDKALTVAQFNSVLVGLPEEFHPVVQEIGISACNEALNELATHTHPLTEPTDVVIDLSDVPCADITESDTVSPPEPDIDGTAEHLMAVEGVKVKRDELKDYAEHFDKEHKPPTDIDPILDTIDPKPEPIKPKRVKVPTSKKKPKK